jgi:hypothetical protein
MLIQPRTRDVLDQGLAETAYQSLLSRFAFDIFAGTLLAPGARVRSERRKGEAK